MRNVDKNNKLYENKFCNELLDERMCEIYDLNKEIDFIYSNKFY